MEIIIDATNSVVGRLASFAAKKLLQGNKIIVVNSEQAIMTGDSKLYMEKYIHKLRLGTGAQKGPHYPRRPEMMVRRMIRGMLPWKRTTGREAYRRIKCFVGVPEEYLSKEKIKIEKKIKTKFITLGEFSKLITQ